MSDSLTRVIDLKKLRDEESYRSGVIRKGIEPELLDDVLQREEICRKLLQEVEELRSQQNAASKDIGRASPEERDAKIAVAASMKELLQSKDCLLYTSPSPRDLSTSRMPSSA